MGDNIGVANWPVFYQQPIETLKLKRYSVKLGNLPHFLNVKDERTECLITNPPSPLP